MVEIRSNDVVIQTPQGADARKVQRKLDNFKDDERKRQERLMKRRANKSRKKRTDGENPKRGNDVDVRV